MGEIPCKHVESGLADSGGGGYNKEERTRGARCALIVLFRRRRTTRLEHALLRGFDGQITSQSALAGPEARAERVPSERKKEDRWTHLCQFEFCPRGRFAVCDREVLQQGGVTDDGGGGVAVLVCHPFAVRRGPSVRFSKVWSRSRVGATRVGRGNALLGDVGVAGTCTDRDR